MLLGPRAILSDIGWDGSAAILLLHGYARSSVVDLAARIGVTLVDESRGTPKPPLDLSSFRAVDRATAHRLGKSAFGERFGRSAPSQNSPVDIGVLR